MIKGVCAANRRLFLQGVRGNSRFAAICPVGRPNLKEVQEEKTIAFAIRSVDRSSQPTRTEERIEPD